MMAATNDNAKIKVMIIDDSAVVRQILRCLIEQNEQMEVTAAAMDPLFAMRYLEKQWPDVILLDIEMPRMDGISFLKKIMAERPTPVVICSAHSQKQSRIALQALAEGAVEVIAKPVLNSKEAWEDCSNNLIQVLHSAAQSNLAAVRRTRATLPLKTVGPANRTKILPAGREQRALVVMGTSTGGTVALERVLTALPEDAPPIAIVQHMPAHFTASFAERLNGLCDITVKEAVHHDRLTAGIAHIAPGGYHMLLKRDRQGYYVEILKGPRVNHHCPSVDLLFNSCAESAGKNALGIIMTGMGDDGARGLVAMRREGAGTIAQDKETSTVFGMPCEAINRGGAEKILPLDAIAQEIMSVRV